MFFASLRKKPARAALRDGGQPTQEDNAERLAQRFHETYERLAPQFGYATRKDTAKPWDEVPQQNRHLMIEVCREILYGKRCDITYGWKVNCNEPE